MKKQLVVVESPAKARTIGRFLGDGVKVLASMGHVRDLPSSRFGVDLANDFSPVYQLTPNGRKVIKQLRSAADAADEVFLATDPDREGEAIAWHLKTLLDPDGQGRFHRIAFHEITRAAVGNAMANPTGLAMDLVDAQQARRVLDRIVGYQVSPMLWRNIRKGTSAGRVQSVALRLIVEREREIEAFVPEEFWNLTATFTDEAGTTGLTTRLARICGEKRLPRNAEQANRLAEALQSPGARHLVHKVTTTPKKQNAAPPFITSTMQQAAGSHLKFGTTLTMRIAQDLYEGVELGSGGPVGLITYMRTDSVHISQEAQAQAREYIAGRFGPEYVPEKPNVYRSRKSAQEAHEAIRPTDVRRTPEELAPFLAPNQLRLYRLIWNRFVASQMAPAQQLEHVVEIESAGGGLDTFRLEGDGVVPAEGGTGGTTCIFRAAARETKFKGCLVVYSIHDLGEKDDQEQLTGALPAMRAGSACRLDRLLTEQNFTTPPGRYSEASLVKALEQNGVGRPSTFASTVSTIIEREYVAKEKLSLVPTRLGFEVNDYLVQRMPELFDVGFTAQMEDKLDQIEEGRIDWKEMLREFYGRFQKWIGEDGAAPAVTELELRALLRKLFPEGYPFDAPEKGPGAYHDQEFIAGILEGLDAGKELTQRQRNAVLNIVAKYAARDEALHAMVRGTGVEGQVEAIIEGNAQKPAVPPEETRAEFAELMAAMKKVAWKKPTRQGRRVYDDGRFFRSLQRQVVLGRALSAAQQRAVLKLAANYAGVIEDFDRLYRAAAGCLPGAGEGEAAGAGEDAAQPPARDEKRMEDIRLLLSLAEKITDWRKNPAKGGRRSFDEQEFVDSLREQFERKSGLSDRQVAVLCRLLKHHEGEIPDYAEHAERILAMTPQPKPLDEKCPLCGAPLVMRRAKGRTFIGCSAYPKCKYDARRTKPDQPGKPAETPAAETDGE